MEALETWKAGTENRMSSLEAKGDTIGQGGNQSGGGGNSGETGGDGIGRSGDPATAAGRIGWGSPTFSETFADLSNWLLFSGEGHAGNGTRDPAQIRVMNNILTILGAAGTANSGGMALTEPAGVKRRYGRWEIRARSFYTDFPPSDSSTTGTGSPWSLGVGGVATPADAVRFTSDQTSDIVITQGGTATNPKVYDGGGKQFKRVTIDCDYVVAQNFSARPNSQYGIYINPGHKFVTIMNCDVAGLKPTGDGDMNGITMFGNDINILMCRIGPDLIATDNPGDSHSDGIQCWASSSKGSSSRICIRGNRIVGPLKPDVRYLHQGVMAEGPQSTDGGGGASGQSKDWWVGENHFVTDGNQTLKFDDIDNVTVTRNIFAGAGNHVVEASSLSSGFKYYSDNVVTGEYGNVGVTATAGVGPEPPKYGTIGVTGWPNEMGGNVGTPPTDGGYHPVAVLLPDSGSVSTGQGEYDFMENGEPGEQAVGAVLHYPTGNGDGGQQIDVADYSVDLREWHNFAIDWQSDGIKLYVDGNLWASHSGGAQGSRLNIQDAQSMHLCLQLDAFQPSGCVASSLQVAWVRVYDPTSSGTPSTGGGTVTLGPPKNLAGSFSGRKLTLTWQDPAVGTPTQTEVHEFRKSPDATLKATVDMPTRTRVSGNLRDGELEYGVRAKDASGNLSKFSATVKAKISGGVGTVAAGQAEGWDDGTAGPNTGTGTASFPGDLIKDGNGIIKWYLTTPEWDPENSSKTWNIKPGGDPPLETFVRDANPKRAFKLNADRNGIICSSDYEGSHTPNSDNTRMELRERNAANQDIEWSTRSGRHQCEIVTQVDRLDGNHMVIGQIHGGNQVDDDLTVFRLEGTELYITNDNDPHWKLIDSNYQLGTKITIKFDVNSSGVCTFFYNGVSQGTLQLPLDDQSYFKAGAYLQRKGSEGSWGQVTLYSAVCTHS